MAKVKKNIKKESSRERLQAERMAAERGFILTMSIGAIVINDKFSQLMRKEVDGLNRVTRFVDLCVETYEALQNDYVTYGDLVDILKTETGLDLSQLLDERMKGARV